MAYNLTQREHNQLYLAQLNRSTKLTMSSFQIIFMYHQFNDVDSKLNSELSQHEIKLLTSHHIKALNHVDYPSN